MTTVAKPRTYTLDELLARVLALPRVEQGFFPTPLHDCPRFTAALGGPRILMKREDMSGTGLGGNKTRLFQFRFAEAKRLGADVFIAGLDRQSNSARQCSAFAIGAGLKPVLVLEGGAGYPQWQGNLLVDHLLGADIRFLRPGGDLDSALRAVAEEYRAAGHQPYVMNHAEWFHLGSACASFWCTIELLLQAKALGAEPTHLYASSGGKGQGGFEVAKRVVSAPLTVVGVSSRRGAHRHPDAANSANRCAAALDLPGIHVTPEEVVNLDDQVGVGYGVPTAAGSAAMKLVAQTEGVLLDPNYTAKAVAGLIEHIRNGRLTDRDTVVFIHTGGIPAIFAYTDALLEHQPAAVKWIG